MTTPKNESIVKGFGLLTLIARHPSGLTLAEAAQAMEMTVPTAHRFLKTLVSVGALERDDRKRYHLGAVLQGSPLLGVRSRDLRTTFHRHAETLSHTLRETVHVARFVDDMVQYVAKAEAPRSLRISTVVGTTLEAYCTGVGKVLLAFMPATELKRYVSGGNFYPLTPKTITTRDGLIAELQKVRAAGYAIDDEEFELGLRCIAAPIFAGDRVIAAISSSGPTSRFVPAIYGEISSEIMRTAAAIGREITSYSLEDSQMRFAGS